MVDRPGQGRYPRTQLWLFTLAHSQSAMRRARAPKAESRTGSPIDYDCLLTPLENTSILRLFDQFPDELSCVRFLFELRGGPMRPCSVCGSRTTWRQDSQQPLFHSKCCGEQVDARSGTFLERVRLDIRMWLYLIATFLNRSTPLSSAFVASHLGLSSDYAWRALAQIRQQIQKIEERRFEPHEFQNCYLDEFLYRPILDSARGTRASIWLLGLSGNQIVHVVALRSRNPGVYRDLLQGLGLLDAKLFSSNLRLAQRLREDFLPTSSCEWTMACSDGPIVAARERLSAFWPFFKRSMRRGSIVPKRDHLSRYISDYVFRFNHAGRKSLMLRRVLQSLEPL